MLMLLQNGKMMKFKKETSATEESGSPTWTLPLTLNMDYEKLNCLHKMN